MTLQKYRDLVIPLRVLENTAGSIDIMWTPAQPENDPRIRFPEDVQVGLHTEIVENGFLITVNIQGRAALICDRCGTEFICPVTGEVRSFYTFAQGLEMDDDTEIHVLPESARKIDLSADALDALMLGLPAKFLCKTSCQGLCDQCGANLNEGDCGCSKDEIDPRWEALRGLNIKEDS